MSNEGMDMGTARQEVSWGRKAVTLCLLPVVLTAAVLAVAAFLLLLSIWNILAAAYCLTRFVVLVSDHVL